MEPGKETIVSKEVERREESASIRSVHMMRRGELGEVESRRRE